MRAVIISAGNDEVERCSCGRVLWKRPDCLMNRKSIELEVQPADHETGI